MKIASKKDIVFLLLVFVFAVAGVYFRQAFIQANVAAACGRNTTIFLSPENVEYDVVHYGQTCGMAGPSFEEIRLRSKLSPHKQKSIFRYQFAHEAVDTDEAVLPRVKWQGSHDVEIFLRHVTDIDYRYGKVRDINIHYELQGHEGIKPPDKDVWERIGLDWGWRVMAEPNATYLKAE